MDLERWQNHNDSPAWVRANRDELLELGFEPPTSLARMPAWLDQYKGAVTRKVKGEATQEADEE